MVTTARTNNLALIEVVPELVLSGNKRQGVGESCIIRSFTFFCSYQMDEEKLGWTFSTDWNNKISAQNYCRQN
jgi:hypothetical protein